LVDAGFLFELTMHQKTAPFYLPLTAGWRFTAALQLHRSELHPWDFGLTAHIGRGSRNRSKVGRRIVVRKAFVKDRVQVEVVLADVVVHRSKSHHTSTYCFSERVDSAHTHIDHEQTIKTVDRSLTEVWQSLSERLGRAGILRGNQAIPWIYRARQTGPPFQTSESRVR